MNTITSPAKWLAAFVCLLSVLGVFRPTSAHAEHDHDHIYVTMVEYVGYDRDSEHYIIKVRRLVEGEAFYYYLHFLGRISSLRGHEGERMQISLTGDGREWARLSFGDHGTWKIHARERAR